MKILSYLLIALSCIHLSATDKFETIAKQYSRPIHILYISNNPKWLSVREDDVITYWTDNTSFLEQISKFKPQNCIVLTGKSRELKHEFLSEAEHFDIAVIDCPGHEEQFYRKWHYADHTYINEKYFNETKAFLVKHQHIFPFRDNGIIPVKSTTKTKHIIKAKKHIPYLAGLNYYLFLMLRGKYPTDKTITDQVYELYDSFYTNDYQSHNMILNGTRLKIIDYSAKTRSLPKWEQDYFFRWFFYRKKKLETYAITQ